MNPYTGRPNTSGQGVFPGILYGQIRSGISHDNPNIPNTRNMAEGTSRNMDEGTPGTSRLQGIDQMRSGISHGRPNIMKSGRYNTPNRRNIDLGTPGISRAQGFGQMRSEISHGHPNKKMSGNIPNTRNLYEGTPKAQGFGQMRSRLSHGHLNNMNSGRSNIPNTKKRIDWFDGTMDYTTVPKITDHNMKQESPQRKDGFRKKHVFKVGFQRISSLSDEDPQKVLTFFSDKTTLQELFKSDMQPDIIVLLVKCIVKVCQTEFDAMKLSVLIYLSKSLFMDKLQKYLLGIKFVKINEKSRNMYFWKDPEAFLNNLLIFCENLMNLSPSTAVDTLRPFFEVFNMSVIGLANDHSERLSTEFTDYFENVQIKLAVCIEEVEKKAAESLKTPEERVDEEPPNDFREINIMPTRDDLFKKTEFLRPNIINGAFRNVEHYLDIQFRLMREDFVAPLREGIFDYRKALKELDKNKIRRKYGNVRFHNNIQIMNFSINRGVLGMDICYDKKLYNLSLQNKKKKQKDNFSMNKRFLYGSLLCLTKDNFETLIFCTVSERDHIQNGVITVSSEEHLTYDIFQGTYLLIESDVFFPPYFHILKALQRPNLGAIFPFEDYIIRVRAQEKVPSYFQLMNDSYKLFNGKTVTLSLDYSWPSKESLRLDESQFIAYKMALTREFVTIQGPPGTGKTFIGLKIVQTLLNNLYLLKKNFQAPILVVCYTNHALDQFLEGILPYTKKLVRIGGQSKNETLAQFNINKMRERRSSSYYQCLNDLRNIALEVSTMHQKLKILKSGQRIFDVSDYEMILSLDFGNLLADYHFDDKPALVNWLLNSKKIHTTQKTDKNIFDGYVSEDDDLELSSDDEDVHRQVYIDDDFHLTKSAIKADGFGVDFLVKKLDFVNQRLSGPEDMSYKDAKQLELARRSLETDINILNERLDRRKMGYGIIPNCNKESKGQQFNIEQRWALYWSWVDKITDHIQKQVKPLMDEYKKTNEAMEETKQIADLETLRSSHIVGITTSGAARLQSLIRSLYCPIVIVEEAAEVMESHVIVSLTSQCQHLIMIGDHQQLRPITATYKMAKKYNLDISLFERMVSNGNHCHQLSVQHRMRPEFAKLITPSIYPVLHNDSSVSKYDNVKGVVKNLFFITHNQHEQEIEDMNSRYNRHEALFLLRLAKYFLQQGYEPEDITILVTYSGQLIHLKRERENIAMLKHVRVSVLDNFQGEENKIILLSLVRNNADGNIGFLSTTNRVCVALSRAREGFYIMGNMDILKAKSPLWSNVNETLLAEQAIGEELYLKCEIHGDLTIVQKDEDFEKVAEGGCQRMCESLLKCGHICKKICHSVDREHSTYKCMEPCEKTCTLGHKCPKLCFFGCGPCQTMVLRTLPCGHTTLLKCHVDYNKIECQERVDVVLPLCNHEMKKKCYQKLHDVKCLTPCDIRLPCGHACRRTCHKNSDPDHLQYECMENCTKLNQGCSLDHPCKKRCHEECSDCTIQVVKRRTCTHSDKVKCHVDVNTISCRAKCKRTLPCGHFCLKLCGDKCDEKLCENLVTKVRPSCGHSIRIKCNMDPERAECRSKCNRVMQCGHICPDLCYKPCDTKKCKTLVNNPYQSLCKHIFQIPCGESHHEAEMGPILMMKYCNSPCETTLSECEHTCKGTCGKCYGGTIHIPCSEPCKNVLVCGHICDDPCRQACPPCKKPCEVRCKHTKCNLKCGEPCPPCMEPCNRNCEHGSCKSKCGDTCNIEACSKRCNKKIICGHRCWGLCGEECPMICKECMPEEFPEIFFGNEDDEDAKFIILKDCGHVAEVEGMDKWMNNEREGEISVCKCPYCSTRVINTPRYWDQVKKVQKDIEKTKMRIFGNQLDIKNKLDKLFNKLIVQSTNSGHMSSVPLWIKEFNKLHTTLVKNTESLRGKNKHKTIKVSNLDIEKLSVQFEVLKMIADEYKNIENFDKKYVLPIVCRLVESIKHIENKVSTQQSMDLSNEMDRLKQLIRIVVCENRQEYKYCNIKDKVQQLKAVICTSIKKFDKDFSADISRQINDIRKSLTLQPLTTEERKMIVQVMGFRAGHWYMCPKGHPYCIADCGGAMEVSRCPECKATIGGRNHSLAAGNSVATFMDGSRHSAWSEAANMANYRM